MGAVRAVFRPEFINRVDEFITFDPLTLTQLRDIVKLQVCTLLAPPLLQDGIKTHSIIKCATGGVTGGAIQK
eukprot:1988001-Pyramimonas_sp.AAC.1